MRRDLFAMGVAATLLVTGDAAAFCRTTTIPAPPDFQPGPGACFTQGAPLYHPSQCLPYRLITRESLQVPNPVLSDLLARAFAAWTAPNAHCTPGITAVELAPVDRADIVGYTVGQHDDDIVGFVKPWKHDVAGETLSLATLTFDASTGEVFDVDLEINDDIAWSTSDAVPPNGYDLQAALTHEAGHMLGLAHSDDVNATMFASYSPGSDAQRTLDDDDTLAVCDVYPTRFSRRAAAGVVPATACQLAPGTPGGGCGDPAITHGCAVSAAAGSTDADAGAALAGVVAIGLGLLRSRRARYCFVKPKSSVAEPPPAFV